MGNQSEGQGFSFRRILPLTTILVVAVIGYFMLSDYLSFEMLSKNREALLEWRDDNFLTAILAFMASYIVIVSFSLPGATVASLTGGFLFAIFPGALINLLSATTGATVIFLAARYGLGDYLASKMDGSEGAVKKFKEGLQRNEISFLFLMRLLPAVPFFVANLVPALVGVRFRNFALTTFLGIVPGTVVITWIGAGLGEVFERGEMPNLDILLEWYILGPILGLCALALLPVMLKFLKKRRG